MMRSSGRRGGGISPALSSPCQTVSRICWKRAVTRWQKSGYIAVAAGEKNRYLPGKQYRILRKGKAVVRA